MGLITSVISVSPSSCRVSMRCTLPAVTPPHSRKPADTHDVDYYPNAVQKYHDNYKNARYVTSQMRQINNYCQQYAK